MAGWAAFALAAALALWSWHAAAARGQAVARACHEVRGPLAAARLGLESSLGAPVPARLRAIEVELARATVALDDLQRVERIQLGGPDVELVDVRSWLSDSVEAWRPVAAACGMEIRLAWTGADVVVWGRQARLAQVTGNLIANALDHGDGWVEVSGLVNGDVVLVEVADGGAGLPDALRGWLEGGGRGGVGGREWGRGRANGRGHGLRIARAVAEAHGGRLDAPGDAGAGARIVLTLPVVAQ